jgi:hypothetical protein
MGGENILNREPRRFGDRMVDFKQKKIQAKSCGYGWILQGPKMGRLTVASADI